MIQGTSLGGTDTINGGGGTNMLTLQNLDNIHFVYNVTNSVINYANNDASITGNITVSNLQELYADDGISGSTLLDLSGAASGTGYIIAGTNNNDEIPFLAGEGLYGTLPNIAANNVRAPSSSAKAATIPSPRTLPAVWSSVGPATILLMAALVPTCSRAGLTMTPSPAVVALI
jgi:hypothetical protein